MRYFLYATPPMGRGERHFNKYTLMLTSSLDGCLLIQLRFNGREACAC